MSSGDSGKRKKGQFQVLVSVTLFLARSLIFISVNYNLQHERLVKTYLYFKIQCQASLSPLRLLLGSLLGGAIKSLERSQVSDFFERVSRRRGRI